MKNKRFFRVTLTAVFFLTSSFPFSPPPAGDRIAQTQAAALFTGRA